MVSIHHNRCETAAERRKMTNAISLTEKAKEIGVSADLCAEILTAYAPHAQAGSDILAAAANAGKVTADSAKHITQWLTEPQYRDYQPDVLAKKMQVARTNFDNVNRVYQGKVAAFQQQQQHGAAMR